jgi:hypothetical protein
MSTKLRFLFVGSVALAVFLLSACSGSGKKFPDTLVIKEGDYTPQLVSSELVVGENRFSFGILTPEPRPVVDAKVHLTFYDLNGGKEVKKFETDAISVVPARDAGLTEQIVHIHPDGTRHIHTAVTDQVGVYVANVKFDEPGNWGVEIKMQSDNPKVTKTFVPRFNVLDKGSTPPLGATAPKSRNLTVNDVADLSQIDTSANPSPDMHTMTIADATSSGKPTLVLFAAPGYCVSSLCGPEYEIMRKLYPDYKDSVNFIHVEFYQDAAHGNRAPVAAAQEWNLQSEPWFFVINEKGVITAKFEGPTSASELKDALKQVQSASSAQR